MLVNLLVQQLDQQVDEHLGAPWLFVHMVIILVQKLKNFPAAKDTDTFGQEKHSHESLARGIGARVKNRNVEAYSSLVRWFWCAWCLQRHERDASL